jgi:hypothetical protein
VAQDCVGLLAFSGRSGNLNEWVELDLSGKLIRPIRLDQQDFTPMAFTTDGHLYRKPDHKAALQLLSQTMSDWQDSVWRRSDGCWAPTGIRLCFRQAAKIPLRWSGSISPPRPRVCQPLRLILGKRSL